MGFLFTDFLLIVVAFAVLRLACCLTDRLQ